MGVGRGAAAVPEADRHGLAGPWRKVRRFVDPGVRRHEGRVDLGRAAVLLHDEDLVFGAVARAFAVLDRRGQRGREAEDERRRRGEGYRNVAPVVPGARAPRRLAVEAEAHVAVRHLPARIEEGAGLGALGHGARVGAGHPGEDRAGEAREAEGARAPARGGAAGRPARWEGWPGRPRSGGWGRRRGARTRRGSGRAQAGRGPGAEPRSRRRSWWSVGGE